MNLALFLEKVRLWIPDNKWVRKVLTEFRIKSFYRGYLSPKEVRWAYGNPERKKALLRKWEKKHPRSAERLNDRIVRLTAENQEIKERTKEEEFLTDLKYGYCAYGFEPYEYINYDLPSKSEEEYHEFISDGEIFGIHYHLNDLKGVSVFCDKWKTYELFTKYYHRECVKAEKEKDFPAFQAFAARHPVFFMKQVYGSSGRAVKKVDMSSCGKTARELFDDMIRNGKHIVEEPIRQSSILSEFNASSVNTVRYATILTKYGPKAATGFFRTGRAGSPVDNAGSGGVFAGVDTETGIVYTPGVDEYGRRYEKHPDSGIVYQGYQLPDWQQLVSICSEAAVTAGEKGCRYVGWDLAHTEGHGWVMVEGNSRGQFVEQNASRKGIRDRIESLMAELS